ncbi:MAG: tetratricopeptide repeat protein [Desulfomicrobium sp.]
MKHSATPTLRTLIAAILILACANGQAQGESVVRPQAADGRDDALHASMEARRHVEGGQKLEREKNLSGAIASYSRAASLVPDSAEAHFALGEALTKAARDQEALVRYTLTVIIAPKHRRALHSRALLCLRMKLYAQARKDLSRLIDLMPGVADYHYQRATTLMKMKSVTEAYHDFLRAHELDSKYPRPTLIWKKDSVPKKVV